MLQAGIIQNGLLEVLSVAAEVMVKAEQDASQTSKDAKPHYAARIALSKAVRPCLCVEIPNAACLSRPLSSEACATCCVCPICLHEGSLAAT